MPRPFSNLIPALVVAGSMLAATALVTRVPRASWAVIAAPVLLVLGLIGADLLLGRLGRLGQRGGRVLPSAGTVIMAVSILVACGIVASDDLGRLGAMVPIFGSCAVLPVILRRSGKEGRR